MKIEITEQRTLNEKETLFVEQACHNAMKERGGDFNTYLTLKSSINNQYQVFITLPKTDHIEDKASFLQHNLITGLRKPVRALIINGNTIGVQIFDDLRNKNLIKDAIEHTLNQFDVEQLGDYQ